MTCIKTSKLHEKQLNYNCKTKIYKNLLKLNKKNHKPIKKPKGHRLKHILLK
jgi:hypothetical protein